MLDKYRNRNWDRSASVSKHESLLETVVGILRVLKRRWKEPIWFLLFFWTVGALYYSFAPRHYRSHSEVLIHNVGRDELLMGSEQVLDEVVEKLSSREKEIFSGVSPERRVAFIREKISMTHPGGRPNILRISYPHEDPQLAQFILTAVVDSFVKFANDQKLRRSIDPISVQKNEFATRLLAVLQQQRAKMDSDLAAKRMELILLYSELQGEIPQKMIPARSFDQLPETDLASLKGDQLLRVAPGEEEKIIRAKMQDPEVQKKIADLKYLNHETKWFGKITGLIVDLVTITNQEISDQSPAPILTLSKPNEPVIPESPFSLNLLFVLATTCGLVCGFGFVFLADRLDDRFRSKLEAEQLLQIPFLGAFSAGEDLHDRTNENTGIVRPDEEVQNAAALIRSRGRKFRSFVMTSHHARCQNPTTAMQLAQAFVDQDEKVLLIDADLRSSELSQLCGLSQQNGLGELLSGDLSSDAARSTIASVVARQDGFSILPAGKCSGDIVSLLSQSLTKRLLKHFEEEYDRVLLFAADLSIATDAAVLAGHVDGCLFSFDLNSKRTKVLKAQQTLQKFGITKIYGLTVQADSKRTQSQQVNLAEKSADESTSVPNLLIAETRKAA